MARDLPQGQITPAARPVSSFVAPGRRDVAAPAQPQMLPNPQGLRILPQASGGSVGGGNRFAELASALSEFSPGLLRVAGQALERQASGEYQRGANEAMRAQVLANQQMLQSGAEYAAQNRRIGRADPEAGLLMDRVNPYRQAGRQNALSRLAAEEAGQVALDEYRALPDAAQLRPGDARLAEVKGRAVQRLAEKYGLNPATPGFVDYVLPALGQAQDRITNIHWDEHRAYLDDTVPKTAAAEIVASYYNARSSTAPDGTRGFVEWTEYDPATGQPRRLSATGADPAAFERGMRMRMEQIVNQMANETGVSGRAAAWQQEALLRAAGSIPDLQLRRILMGVGVGPVQKDGSRVPASLAFGPEFLKLEDEMGDRQWKTRQRAQEEAESMASRLVYNAMTEIPPGPGQEAAVRDLVATITNGEHPDVGKAGSLLDPIKVVEMANKAGKASEELAARTYDRSLFDAFLLDMETLTGSAWNPQEALAAFRQLIKTVPKDEQPAAQRAFEEKYRRREADVVNLPWQQINRSIETAIRANIRTKYPGNETEAALRGANPVEQLAWGNANTAESVRRQKAALEAHVTAGLQQAAAKKGSRLTPSEASAEINRSIQEYGSRDPKQRAYLFPGVGSEPSVGGARPQPPGSAEEAPKPPAGRQQFTGRVYPAGQLDNAPDRAQRLRSGDPILDGPSAMREAQRVLSGGTPSAPVVRAAKDSGMSPGRFLLRQLDAYPGLRLPQGARDQLLRSSRDAQALGRVASQPGGGRPLDAAGRWAMDLLMGTRPAMATAMPTSSGAAMRGGGAVPAGGERFMPAPEALRGPTLAKLGAGRMVSTRPGLCTTAVLESMSANGIPNPPATGRDAGNNPRGLASQLVRSYGWRPLAGIGQARTINSPYGSFSASVMSGREYQAAVDAGRIPSGALVFSSIRDWSGTAPGSRGFDVAIARNNGRSLWNGGDVGRDPYRGGSKQVFVLLPGDTGKRNGGNR